MFIYNHLFGDLKKLWSGVQTYNVSRKQNFMMRASLMWTINNFPTYGMLSGWGTQGKLACPYCMEHKKAFRLEHGKNNSWFDSHRRFLLNTHTFKRNKKAFVNAKVEMGGPPSMLTSEEVYHTVKNIPR